MRPEVASLLPFTQNRQDALNRWELLCYYRQLFNLNYTYQ